MLDFLTRFFKREENSKTLAKERLRLVLMSDRVSLAPDIFDEMKGEMLAVIRRYLDIDERALDMHFENLERQFALLANIPVLKVRTADEIKAAAAARAHANGAASNGTASNGAAVHGANTNGVAAIDAESNEAKPAAPRRRRRRKRSPSVPPASAETPSPEAADGDAPGPQAL